MKTRIIRTLSWPPPFLFFFALVLASCATSVVHNGDPPSNAPLPTAAAAKNFSAESKSREGDGRMRIYQASQTIEVADVAASVQLAEERVRARKGYVESSSQSSNGESHSSLTLRVPATELRAVMDEFAALGNETRRRTTAEDTTVAYLDLEARLKNAEALRDRLRSLLDSAKSVKEILEVEKELARVQSDLDAMKGRIRLMQSQVRLAKIDLILETREIPGPIGAAGKGLWWSFRKLFVLK